MPPCLCLNRPEISQGLQGSSWGCSASLTGSHDTITACIIKPLLRPGLGQTQARVSND